MFGVAGVVKVPFRSLALVNLGNVHFFGRSSALIPLAMRLISERRGLLKGLLSRYQHQVARVSVEYPIGDSQHHTAKVTLPAHTRQITAETPHSSAEFCELEGHALIENGMSTPNQHGAAVLIGMYTINRSSIAYIGAVHHLITELTLKASTILTAHEHRL